jgi:hypothetical protein
MYHCYPAVRSGTRIKFDITHCAAVDFHDRIADPDELVAFEPMDEILTEEITRRMFELIVYDAMPRFSKCRGYRAVKPFAGRLVGIRNGAS